MLRGDRETTRAEARETIGALDALWVSERDDGATKPSEVRRLLGRSFDAVVLDLHDGLHADVLGQSHGLIWGGGGLVLRMPEAPSKHGDARLAAFPYEANDVGDRFFARVARAFDAVSTPGPLSEPPREIAGTPEQDRVVEALQRAFAGPPSLVVLLSDRGRGKSSALGRALKWRNSASPSPLQWRRGRGVSPLPAVAVSAGQAASTREIFRFALGDAEPALEGRLRFVSPAVLAAGEARFDVIVIDEAAQLPVPRLRQIVRAHPEAVLAFASTARGYEGTGRGFVLRFLEQLRHEDRPLTELRLEAPIRWDAEDPLERAVFDALLLDAEPPTVTASTDRPLTHRALSQEELGEDEALLRAYFGLLVHAHYRTTPSDLHRLLDAPNLRAHASFEGETLVAATLVALEGSLPPDRCLSMARGAERIRGHALADTLVCHSGRVDAGSLSMVRSVRIAVHPNARLEGIGAALVNHVHETYAPDLFGTLFGATAELLRFRRAVGYELVRVGASRGTRTGEPAAVMLRPVSDAARALLEGLRADLARDLPLQLELLAADLVLEPALRAALEAGLPPAAPLSDADAEAIVVAYLDGPRPFESAAYAVTQYVARHAEALDELPNAALIRRRVLDRASWAETTKDAGFPSIPAAMRALRRTLRELRARVK